MDQGSTGGMTDFGYNPMSYELIRNATKQASQRGKHWGFTLYTYLSYVGTCEMRHIDADLRVLQKI